MAVDQDGGAEVAVQPHEKRAAARDDRACRGPRSGQRVVDRDALVVDFLGVADHARHRAEPAGDPHRAGIGERGKSPVEHPRVELVGLAVDVDKAAREMRPHQRIAVLDHAGDQLADEAVLGAAQGAISSREASRNARG